MDKFSELKAAAMAATPGPWVVTEKNNVEAPNQKRFRPVAYILGSRAEHKRAADAAFIAAANPAVVLALLAELEAKDERITDLEAIRAAAEKLVRCKGRYHSEQNYRALAALFGVEAPDLPPVDGDSETVIAELRAKLATPVRLPNKNDAEFWFGSTFQVAKFDRAVERAISAAGFKFVGDE